MIFIWYDHTPKGPALTTTSTLSSTLTSSLTGAWPNSAPACFLHKIISFISEESQHLPLEGSLPPPSYQDLEDEKEYTEYKEALEDDEPPDYDAAVAALKKADDSSKLYPK